MFRRWLASHRSLAITLASAVVVVALAVTAGVTSNGYTAQQLDLQDPAVWVGNATAQYIGRANTEIRQLDTVVPVAGAQVDILQSGSTLVAVDRADARADIVNPATAAVDKTVPLPPESPHVYLAGSNVVIYSQGTGELWITPFDTFSTFDEQQQPTLNVGAGSLLSVDPSGVVYAYSPDGRQVRRIDAATAGVVTSTASSRLTPGRSDVLAVTSVGRHWAVLDATTAQLEVDGALVDLSSEIGTDADATLQAASASGDGILVAYTGGLLRVPFSGGSPEKLVSDRTGAPAAPTILDGCAYAAWTDGSAWRECADARPVALVLQGITGTARLQFQSNGDRLLLNDSVGGASWAVQHAAQLIDNWSDLVTDDQKQTESQQNQQDSETVVQKDQQPPVAVDDSLGARPGTSSTLPVLLNDYDPNGDVLVIDSVAGLDASLGTLAIITQGQQLQLTLPSTATGELSFQYTISDGRGGTATATVTVTVRTPTENSPPQQVRATRATVDVGGQVTIAALGDWVDPDGDPFYLTGATSLSGGTVDFGPDGTVVVTADASASGTLTIALTVSDTKAVGNGSALVTVVASGKVPITTDPFAVQAFAGRPVTISPLEHVHGGAARVTLNAVPARPGATLTPSYAAGTFTFSSDEVRTHYIDYVVTDGISTVTGTVRVDVAAPPVGGSAPITIPKTIFVHTLSRNTIDVASTDIDPGGGVLLVTGTHGVPANSGVQAEVLDQQSIRVTLLALLSGPVTFGYDITNGVAEATGTVTVVEIPLPSPVQPPVARDDVATARVGDAIDIDVLANDDQPDGLAISLDPTLPQGLTGDSGLLFVSGRELRYLAPDHPGNFSAIYQITGPTGQTAQAVVRIQVREASADTNSPPVPADVTARVLAGQTVRIPIPLSGIDPDGDSVTLLGQASNPEKGIVTATGAAYLDYQAGAYSAGTDSFTYSVIDALGARATGVIRVGIAARTGGTRSPVAVADDVVVRPGTAVSVQVLANDSDPDGGTLHVVSATPNDSVTTAVVEAGGTIVTVRPPSVEGTYGVVYTIANQSGAESSNFITVHVADDAPLSYPRASDTVLTLADIVGRSSIDVDVLGNVFFADGPASSLGVSVVPGYSDSAVVTSDKRIRVVITPQAQIIPFTVSHPQDPSIRSYALIWVPGSTDALPQLNPKAPALTVDNGTPLTIDLNQYVIAAAGHGVRLTDSSSVIATHANGDPLVVDDHTLRFTSAAHYSGPASISFQVTDSTTGTDPGARVATLVLPITVTQRDNAPPVFTGATLDFEPGQERSIDLVLLTDYPHPADVSQLVFTALAPLPAGFTYELHGRTLTISADVSATVGSTTGLTIAVRDARATGQSGRITLGVVSSTRPLAQPAPDVALVRRGESTVIDVLANDQATNPFPGTPLRVLSIAGLGGSNLPAGVSVQVGGNGSRLTVSVASDAAPTDTNLQYEVADATNDPSRYTFGTVRISVQDVPDTPVAVVRQADAFVGGELKVRITPPQENNSGITGYRIVSSSHGAYTQNCGLTVVCSLTGLQFGTDYRFSVIASNGIGDSQPSPPSAPMSADFRPAAPATVSATASSASDAPSGKSLTISWSTVPDPGRGSPVKDYVVEITGPGVDYTATGVTSPLVTTAGGALSNDTVYTVAVHARNSAPVLSDDDWRRTSTTARTVGPPTAPSSGPTAALTDDASGSIRVTWGASSSNGSGSVSYSVGRLSGAQSAPACSTGPGKPGTDAGATDVSSGWVDTSAVDGESYTYVVYSDNGLYCTAAATSAIQSEKPPGQASGTVTVADSGSGQYDLLASGLGASGIVQRFEYRLDGSSWATVPASGWLTSSADSSHYGVATSVTFRACRDTSSDYCGAASSAIVATPVDTRASFATCVASAPPQMAAPSNAAGTAVSYAIAYGTPDAADPATTDWSAFTFSDSDAVPTDAVAGRVRATVTADGNSYIDSGYSEATCGP